MSGGNLGQGGLTKHGQKGVGSCPCIPDPREYSTCSKILPAEENAGMREGWLVRGRKTIGKWKMQRVRVRFADGDCHDVRTIQNPARRGYKGSARARASSHTFDGKEKKENNQHHFSSRTRCTPLKLIKR